MPELTVDDHCIVPFSAVISYEGVVQRVWDPATNLVTAKSHSKRTLESHPPKKEAKVFKGAPGKCYFVHYAGWPKSQDEWIRSERALECTPENIEKMKQQQAVANAKFREDDKRKDKKRKMGHHQPSDKPAKKHKPEPKVNIKLESKGERDGTPAKTTSKSTSKTSSKERSKAIKEVTPEIPLDIQQDTIPYSIQIHVPERLKRVLVGDWELVTHARKLVALPRPISVAMILEEFKKWVYDLQPEIKGHSGKQENLDDFCSGLKQYFGHALGMMLLYRYERNQYFRLRHGKHDFDASEVYGAEHLLRLYVTMPALLAQTSIDQASMSYIKSKLDLLGSYLELQADNLFCEKAYEASTRAYESQALYS